MMVMVMVMMTMIWISSVGPGWSNLPTDVDYALDEEDGAEFQNAMDLTDIWKIVFLNI